MFPSVWDCRQSTPCFPRVRGDVPFGSFRWSTWEEFSPRARGCSAAGDGFKKAAAVFPACAGMFPVPEQCRELLGRFPRVRGDVPRGGAVGGRTPSVFPACAGMFPTEEELDRKAKGFPRVRGDVPSPQMLPPASWWFSPRARGCSCKDQSSFAPRCVFPACAGMFPSRPPLAMFSACFPRVRGDVPCWSVWDHFGGMFSPRARGCSLDS